VLAAAVDSAHRDLVSLANSEVDSKVAVGVNLEHDWRVPRARLEEFWKASFHPGISRFEERFDVFVARLGKREFQKHFLHPENASNYANAHHETRLFTVFRIPRNPELLKAALRAAGISIGPTANDATILARTQEIFPRGKRSDIAPQGQQRVFLEAVLRGAGRSTYPVWVTPYTDEMKRLLPKGPAAWLDAVGMASHRGTYPPGTPVPAQLFIAFRYRKGHVSLFRPTMLEVYQYPHHFPGPPERCRRRVGPAACCGHPVGLSAPSWARLRFEYIHSDFGRTSDHAIGWGWVEASGPDPLKMARVKHHHLLSRHYSGINEWMKEPV
jgi:hypothetical protein